MKNRFQQTTIVLFSSLALLVGLIFTLSTPVDAGPVTLPDEGTGATAVANFDDQGNFHYLTGPNEGASLTIAFDYLTNNHTRWQVTQADLASLVVRDQYRSQHNKVTHIYLRQQVHGLPIIGAEVNINIGPEGQVINVGQQLIPQAASLTNSEQPTLSAEDAILSAAEQLGLEAQAPLQQQEAASGVEQTQLFSTGGFSQRPIPAQLVYQPAGRRGLRLAWQINIYELDGHNWWDLRVDAHSGAIISQDNWVDHDDWGNSFEGTVQTPLEQSFALSASSAPTTYVAYGLPIESPNYASPAPPNDARTNEFAPWHDAPTASPFGWHDTDGDFDPDFTTTRGNNVDAHKGSTRYNCGPTLDCNSPLNLNAEPTTTNNLNSALINLFYWNNITHDVIYEYGFDEAAGNFQENNYGNGGAGSDSVDANAQATGNCNATMGTPADGSNPTMSMFTCNLATPSRDGDLDNGVIVHEYTHGISNRLTGGPGNVNCLNNNEQMGEGWSDWYGLWLTMESGDSGIDSRPIGTWLLGEGPNGAGVRPTPYSTDMNINPTTYGDIGSLAIPHGVGYAWSQMVWEVTWNLIDKHGFNSDFYADWNTGGNNLAMQLVTDGMKLQPCSPGFVDGRDAILAADTVLTGGANQCEIWAGFAKRGLGFSADQGSSGSTSDGTEAFDLPPICLQTLKISKSADPTTAVAGSPLTYTLVVSNDTAGTLTNVVITDVVPAGTTYINGSASDGGSESGGVVSWPAITLNSGQGVVRTFQVTVDNGLGTTFFFTDTFEAGLGNWTTSGLWNMEQESDSCGSMVAPFPSSDTAVYYGLDTDCDYDTGAQTIGSLTLNSAVLLSGTNPSLTFASFEETECGGDCEWDNRFVEINDGSGWDTLGEATNEGSWYEKSFDLTAYSGQSVQIRFRFDSDDGLFNTFFGWLVDDVFLLEESTISNTACVTTAEGDNACTTIETQVLPEEIEPGEPIIAISPPALSSTQDVDTTMVESLTISNTGTADLNWSLAEDNSFNGPGAALLDCNAPVDIPWLSLSPTTGTVMTGTATTVNATFDSTGLLAATYQGTLCLSSNDPITPLLQIPVTLTVNAAYGVDLSGNQAKANSPGSSVIYSVAITNTGNTTDTFSISASGNSWTTTPAPNTIQLGPGATSSFNVTVDIPGGAGNGDMDTATISATSQSDGGVSDSAQLTTTASTSPVYDVLLSADQGQTGQPGTTVTYTLAITNSGNTTDTFDLTVGGNSWTAVPSPSTIPLAAGASTTFEVTITIPGGASGGASDTATISATSQNDGGATDSADLTTTAANLYAVNLSADDSQTGQPETTVTYTLAITNSGNTADTFDLTVGGNSWTAVPSPNTIPLAAGASTTFEVTVTIPGGASGGASDTATLTATSQNDGGATDSADLTTTAANLYAVNLSADDSQTGQPGTTVTYTLAITNNGNTADTFDLTVGGNSWTAVPSPSTIPLVAGASTTFEVTVTIPGGASGGASDTATLTATSQNDGGATDSADLTTTAANLYAVNLSADDSQTGQPGTTVTYTLAITNNGNTADTFDLTVGGNSWTAVPSPSTIPLAAGASTTFEVTVTIPGGASGGASDTATLTATSQNDGGATDSADLTTTAANLYAVNLSASQAQSGTVGSVISYTIRLTNSGNTADTFDLSVSGASWTTNPDQTAVALAAGTSTTIVVEVSIPAGANDGDMDIATINATSQGDNGQSDSLNLTTTAVVEQETFYIYMGAAFNP